MTNQKRAATCTNYFFNIVRFEADKNYTTFFCDNRQRIVVSETIKKYEEILPVGLFFRSHQSHIIQRKFVKSFIKESGGFIEMTDGGRSWSRVEMPGHSPSIIHFFDEMHGWTYRFAGRAKPGVSIITHSVTNDGGDTWTHIGSESWSEPPGTSLPPRDSFEGWINEN